MGRAEADIDVFLSEGGGVGGRGSAVGCFNWLVDFLFA